MSDEGTTKKSDYCLEYASSAISKCKGNLVLVAQSPKGSYVLAQSLNSGGQLASDAWRHWGCVTPKIISNMKALFESADKLDGFDGLKDEDKERIQKAWEDGKVTDEDIPETARKAAGDYAPARRKPRAKKAAASSEVGDKEESEEKPKKRAPVKKPAAEKKVAEKKAPAKKRAPKKKDEEEESGQDFVGAITEVQDDEEDAEEVPKKHKRSVSSKPASTAKKTKVAPKSLTFYTHMPADNVALVGALPNQATTSQPMSYDEANAFEKEKALDNIESGANNVTMPPPSTSKPFPLFNPLQQPTFTPSTPGTSTQDMSKEIHNIRNSFDHAMDIIQGCTIQVASCPMVDPIPVRKQRAIIQLQKEGLEDHQVVQIIKHFQADVSIADSYLVIEKESIRKLFLSTYLQ